MGTDIFEGKTTAEQKYGDETYVTYTETKEYGSYDEIKAALLELTYNTEKYYSLEENGLILCAILLWASISDIGRHEVPDFITVLILVLAFVGFEPVNLPSMLVGVATVFLPQLTVSMLRRGRAVGGADIKISTAIAFLLGAEKGIFALLAGLLSGVIVMFIVRKVKKETNKEPFALVPFLSFGAMLAFMI